MDRRPLAPPSTAGWHGAKRKSRKPRVKISGTLGPSAEWRPTDSVWSQLEARYGKPFGDELRADIENAVGKYHEWADFETSAPFVDDFVDKLRKAQALARELERVVVSFGKVATSSGDAEPSFENAAPLIAPHWERYYPRDEVESSHEEPPADDKKTIESAIFESAWASEPSRGHRNFRETVHTISKVLNDTLDDVSRPDSAAFSEGEAWGDLIRRLARAFENAGFKVTAAKGRTRAPSPFVNFVEGMQETFDESLRRHPTADSLSKAISDSLRDARRKKRDAIPQNPTT